MPEISKVHFEIQNLKIRNLIIYSFIHTGLGTQIFSRNHDTGITVAKNTMQHYNINSVTIFIVNTFTNYLNLFNCVFI